MRVVSGQYKIRHANSRGITLQMGRTWMAVVAQSCQAVLGAGDENGWQIVRSRRR